MAAIIVCDICGTELTDSCRSIPVKVDEHVIDDYIPEKAYDFCFSCYKRIKSLVSDLKDNRIERNDVLG